MDPRATVTLFEAGPRLGGSLYTERRDGFLIEHGADSFITNLPFAVDLCRRIGFSDELISTNAAGRRAFVVRRGRLRPVPEGFALMAPARIWPVIKTPILSPLGKMRLAWEYFVPRRSGDGDESLGSFVRRRLGREVFDRLVQPLVAGIYTADPERLSLAATLPRFIDMERNAWELDPRRAVGAVEQTPPAPRKPAGRDIHSSSRRGKDFHRLSQRSRVVCRRARCE